MEFSNTYVKVRLDVLLNNFREIQKKAGVPVLAVVKADAYGHGAVKVAKYLEAECDFFGVANVAEALQLRNAGITTPILVLGHVSPKLFSVMAEQEIRSTIFTLEDAKELSRQAVALGKTAKFHLAVDTGMNRIGFLPTEENADICKEICSLPGLAVEGLFSHFATADTASLEATHAQMAKFREFYKMLQQRGVTIPICHIDNSAGIMNFGASGQMVRAGIILYGLYPSDEVDKAQLNIQPALSWHAMVSHIKTLPAGCPISYGGTYVTEKETVVATVSAGYADGYRRCLSSNFYVLINGQKAPILGRVCMDQFMVDVTDIPGVQVGDEVVLLGQSGEETISAEALAEASNSFNYEQICDISTRVSRVYYDGDRETDRINYLL